MIDFIESKLQIYSVKGINCFWEVKKKLKNEGIILSKQILIKRIKSWKKNWKS